MSEVTRTIDQLKRAHDGDPWHGSSLKGNLEGVTAEQAAVKPPNGAHSIWELVLHLTGWRNEVARRTTGAPAGEPPEGDWPDVDDTTPERWAAALAALDESHQRLVAAVKQLAEDRLHEPTRDPRNGPLGTGVTYYELLHGAAQHDAYHSGQIAIIRKWQMPNAECQMTKAGC
jgi:uncharacterized damage-inducible protein DinB